jgi:hypothetical protein
MTLTLLLRALEWSLWNTTRQLRKAQIRLTFFRPRNFPLQITFSSAF